jgi:hypothetical protein
LNIDSFIHPLSSILLLLSRTKSNQFRHTIMNPSICHDKDFFYLADAIDASPRVQTPPPFPLLRTSPTLYHDTNGSDPYLESPLETRPRVWNPKWPSRAEWVKKTYLDYCALSPSERVRADFYKARSDRYKKEMDQESNERYRGSLTIEELEQALDKFQTLLPPTHTPGTNPHQEESPSTPKCAEQCITPFSNYLANRRTPISPIPSTPINDNNFEDDMATPRMTRKSSTLESFLSFMTPKTIGSVRRRKEKKRGKASFSVL